jgi:predicted SAM-dependent methyltransferase
MLSRQAKAAYYATMGPFMWLNAKVYRLARAPMSGTVRVHLGPGQAKYLPGWINIDANMFTGKVDVWADLRNQLPFRDNSVSAVYSHHMIEHLPDLATHFRDVFRCLKPGGVYRVGGPHGENAMRKYLDGDKSWFGDYPDKRRSIGGKLENFIFCRQEHLTILTSSFLEELMIDAGFEEVREQTVMRKTEYPKLFADVLAGEYEGPPEMPHTLMMECRKPLS